MLAIGPKSQWKQHQSKSVVFLLSAFHLLPTVNSCIAHNPSLCQFFKLWKILFTLVSYSWYCVFLSQMEMFSCLLSTFIVKKRSVQPEFLDRWEEAHTQIRSLQRAYPSPQVSRYLHSQESCLEKQANKPTCKIPIFYIWHGTYG